MSFSLYLLLRNAVLSEDTVQARALAPRLVKREGGIGEDEAEQIALDDEFVVVRDEERLMLDSKWGGAGPQEVEDPL